MGCSICLPEVETGRILYIDTTESVESTSLYYTKLHDVINTVPTNGFNVELLQAGQQRHSQDVCKAGDRKTKDVTAVVCFFDIDATGNTQEFAVRRLEQFLAEYELRKCPVAIAVNRQDLATGNVSVHKITNELSDKAFLTNRFWKVFTVCNLTGDGFPLLLNWVDQHLGKERNVNNEPQVKPMRRKRKVAHGLVKEHEYKRDQVYQITDSVVEDDVM